MRYSEEREDDRDRFQASSARSGEEVKSTVRGEATDPHQLVMFWTPVSGDKAVAHILGRVPWDE